MVEGHSVHRVAALHRKRLIGKSFKAWSPNGRFKEGAELINMKVFFRIEAVGKNLFAFFGDSDEEESVVVVHIHFGMAGNWAVYTDPSNVPQPSNTNRLRLEHAHVVADLSAMTVQHGKMSFYLEKRNKLGEDPLREDADQQRLWARVKVANKSIGALIMDQSYFSGPGNIYRCEILFKAGIHPETKGKDLDEDSFKRIWHHTVALLRRGFETGSILTVDPEEAKALGKPKMRRYIYNTSKCPRCETSIKAWPINNRTCYACTRCQPLGGSNTEAVVTPTKNCVPFNSHCAREPTETRLRETGPERLTVKEIKAELSKHEIQWPTNAKKSLLVELLRNSQDEKPAFVSPEAAAAEKAAAGESLAVEHIAELAPSQARVARAKVLEFQSADDAPPMVSPDKPKSSDLQWIGRRSTPRKRRKAADAPTTKRNNKRTTKISS